MADDDNAELAPSKPKKARYSEEDRSSRSTVQKIDWSLCLFCQKVKHKGVKTLIKVATFEASEKILEAAHIRGDQSLIVNIGGADLIASDAKYHSSCRANYVSKSNLKYQGFREENEEQECLYSAAFNAIVDEITPGLQDGKVYDMSYLLDRYKAALLLENVACDNYRSAKLKKRLVNHFSEGIVFQKQPDPSKPELVYSSDLSVASIVSVSAASAQETKHGQEVHEGRLDLMQQDDETILHRAAQIIRNDLKTCKGIPISPLTTDDITLDKGRSLIPVSLRQFLTDLICKPDKKRDSETSKCDQEKERRVAMLGQDIVHAVSNSQVKTPKHIGLAVTVHHLTGSKEIVTLLNRMGHCSSYDDVEIVNTAWAREMTARAEETGVIVPSNITPGSFVQFAADNNDLNEETLDGKKTTHATTLVVYQRQQFGPKPPPKIHADHSVKRRSLQQPAQGQVIEECSMRGKRPAVTSFVGKAKDSYFTPQEESPQSIDKKDLAWFLLRLNKKEVSDLDDHDDKQTIPSWSAFNAEMASSVESPRTVIGYCPMIAGSPTEYSTIYTVLKTVLSMTKHLGQSTAVVTFDLAIYIKAKEIQWRYPQEFEDLIIRMGGFHIALNFLAVIGKKFQESGLEDVLTESGLYGSSSTAALLQGKSYNRGVRAHKLLMEALLRLQWESFLVWVSKEKETSVEEDGICNFELVNAIVQRYKKATTSQEKKDAYLVLCNTTKQVDTLLRRFKEGTSSKLFKFWDEYIEMVLLLLKFIRAEREGNWQMHLEAAAEMIPHFFAMDRVNYSRWLPVYIMDMYQLPEIAEEVYNEFVSGNHAISRSASQPFNQVWTDMALEQSVNLDSKTRGGIVGITQRPGALEKWFLTAHERSATTTATKEMLAIGETSNSAHKESSGVRVKRDEDDIRKVVNTLKTVMANPFEAEGYEDDIPLSNLATGVVLPDELSQRLLNATSLGRDELKSFVSKRLHTNEVGFWEPLHKMNIKTFASLSKKVKAKSADEKLMNVSADRNLFGRLLIASRSRDVNLREVLKYELDSVPRALAHTDGSLRKTAKSVLLGVLESLTQPLPRLPPQEESHSTAYIIDGMALVQRMKSAGSATFGDLAFKYLEAVIAPLGKNGCKRVDVVFDRYDKEDSIKEGERLRRGASSSHEVRIAGPSTRVPKKWVSYISNPKNKTSLKIFLSERWKTIAKIKLKPGEELVLAGCYDNSSDSVLITSAGERPMLHLTSNQEEADTRMLLHAKDCKQDHQRIVIQSPDTDVAVLSVYVYNLISPNQLWFRTGVKDKLRFLPVHRLADKLGEDLCKLLPVFHALTGCDTTSALHQMGKKKPWKALTKNKNAYGDLASLGDNVPPSRQAAKSAEAFISSLYAPPSKAGRTSDDVRYWVFCQKNQKNEGLPPTSDSLQLHIQRVNYQVMVWKRCLEASPLLPSPLGNGWEIEDGRLKPVLMTKDAAPKGLAELTVCRCAKTACRTNSCVCRVNELSCTESCGCMAGECENPHTSQFESDDDDDD